MINHYIARKNGNIMPNTTSLTFAKKGNVPNRGFLNGIPLNQVRYISNDRIMATIPFEDDYAEIVMYRSSLLPSWANSNGGDDDKCNLIIFLNNEYTVIPHKTVKSIILDGQAIINKYNEKTNPK